MRHGYDRFVTRRGLLSRAAGGFAFTLAAGQVWWWPKASQAATGSPLAGEPLITRVTRPFDAETPVETLTSWLTPIDRFFVRSHFGPPAPELVDESRWRLRINGLVDRPLTLSFKDLGQWEETTVTAVVQCAGNGRAFFRPRVPGVQWERGAVGNARWTGVRLRDILTRAGLQATARHLQVQGADRPVLPETPQFVRSLPIEKALHPDTILAYRMNDEPLPLLHGAPLRLIAPGWMADSCLKWVTDLSVQDHEAQGFYMQTAYRYPLRPIEPGASVAGSTLRPVEEMIVKSLIVQPRRGSVVVPGPVPVQGLAWTGEGKVVAVEVSVDEGRTWEPAKLVGEEAAYAWRRWEFNWSATGSGSRAIWSRAIDDRGRTQPLVSPWNPSGFLWNGVDSVPVEIRRV